MNIRLVAEGSPTNDGRPDELSVALSAHPLIYQEIPYETEYVVLAGRVLSARMRKAPTPDEMYWQLRRSVVLRHTAELPTEIRGPDAERLLDRVFTRHIGKMRVGRCSYQIACYYDGGMITDGVLLRLEDERFWYAQGGGDLFSWLRAHADGLDVEVFDPEVFVSQVQGPASLEVLGSAVDGAFPEPFDYFDLAEVQIAGQPVVVTRTGFTNELGWEFYLPPDVDATAVGDRVLEAGEPFGMLPVPAEGFRARRIEAGLYNAGADFDDATTPFAAGLGHMVDLEKGDFSGKTALEKADKGRRTWGLRVREGVARRGRTVLQDDETIGLVSSSGWSPFQECGVAIVRLDDPSIGPGTILEVVCNDGVNRTGEICDTPMYDQKREIPRGKVVAVP